jgi:hypothetical protein
LKGGLVLMNFLAVVSPILIFHVVRVPTWVWIHARVKIPNARLSLFFTEKSRFAKPWKRA